MHQRYGLSMLSIFIQISSYHDHELSKTIKNAIEKSSGNNVINFGVHSIYYKNNDVEIPKNVRYEISEAPNNLGMGRGRKIAHSFYDGENYYLQVDAHTRFDKDWDMSLIQDIKKYKDAGIEKPLLSSYPKAYRYIDGIEQYDQSDTPTTISFHENKESFRTSRIPSQTAMHNQHENIFTKSVSGGFIFTENNFIEPNDKIFANGEEIFIAARAFTNGYDLLLPSKVVVSHLYYDGKKTDRRLAWSDFPELCNRLDFVSKMEIYDTLTQNKVGPKHLGRERSLEEYTMYSGLNFKTGEVVVDVCQS